MAGLEHENASALSSSPQISYTRHVQAKGWGIRAKSVSFQKILTTYYPNLANTCRKECNSQNQESK